MPIGDDLAAAVTGGLPGAENGHCRRGGSESSIAGALPAHTLRHRFATRTYRGSRNLRTVQTLLGHSSVVTTERNTAVDDDEIRAAMTSAID
jgi:site-specific recombinase XerD